MVPLRTPNVFPTSLTFLSDSTSLSYPFPRRSSSASGSSYNPSHPLPLPSLPPANLPALQSIVRSTRDFFGTKIAILTIVREGGPPLLVTEGIPEEVEKAMRGTQYCSLSVLSNGEEFVVLNPHEDWRCVPLWFGRKCRELTRWRRFESNVLTSGVDARFYAGALSSFWCDATLLTPSHRRTAFLPDLAGRSGQSQSDWNSLHRRRQAARDLLLHEASTAVRPPSSRSDAD